MVKDLLTPDYIFESSWEVCNKVGGIYTVLSTRANTLQEKFRDRIFFIGPDVWQGKENPLFIESDNLCAAWKKHALEKDELSVRIGRWNIPGEPIVILVDFQPFFEKKDDIYTEMWNRYQVDSLHAYGDYDEASMFSYAAGRDSNRARPVAMFSSRRSRLNHWRILFRASLLFAILSHILITILLLLTSIFILV